jgi:hypothetical protein
LGQLPESILGHAVRFIMMRSSRTGNPISVHEVMWVIGRG